jgi:uncharacterized membrane protein
MKNKPRTRLSELYSFSLVFSCGELHFFCYIPFILMAESVGASEFHLLAGVLYPQCTVTLLLVPLG